MSRQIRMDHLKGLLIEVVDIHVVEANENKHEMLTSLLKCQKKTHVIF